MTSEEYPDYMWVSRFGKIPQSPDGKWWMIFQLGGLYHGQAAGAEHAVFFDQPIIEEYLLAISPEVAKKALVEKFENYVDSLVEQDLVSKKAGELDFKENMRRALSRIAEMKPVSSSDVGLELAMRMQKIAKEVLGES